MKALLLALNLGLMAAPLLALVARATEPMLLQHAPIALSFTASRDDPWRTFPTQATFVQGTRRIVLDAFWDGGLTWSVRFAAPTPGEWSYTIASTDPALDGTAGVLLASTPTAAQLAWNPNLRGQVRTSPNGHHFTYADGTPVLLLGDCLLLGGRGMENGNFPEILDHRRAAGFNALNVRLCKMGSKNEGGLVYEGGNVAGLNPRHFEWIDRRLQVAWERGFITFFMPDFLGTGGYTQSDVQDLWRYLLARYSAYNVCAIITGEYDNPRRLIPFWKDQARWIEVGNHVRQINDRGLGIPIGTHPVTSSSGRDFHGQRWLDYNQVQAKNWTEFDNMPLSLLEDYARTPAKPTFYAEGTYENQPWNGIVGTASTVRHQTWVGYLCGAAAVDYGEHQLKGGQLNGEPLANFLSMPGARQAGQAAHFLRALPWWRMAPHREALLVNGVVPVLTDHKTKTILPYCLAASGEIYVAYLMAGLEKESLTLTGLGTRTYIARWIDPRTFAEIPIADGRPIQPDSAGHWSLPARPAPADEDWVLVVTR